MGVEKAFRYAKLAHEIIEYIREKNPTTKEILNTFQEYEEKGVIERLLFKLSEEGLIYKIRGRWKVVR